MSDRKPPRIAADERQTLLALLSYQRDSFTRKVSGVADGEATTTRVPSGTTLLWLANHMADAEITWVIRRFAQSEDAAFGDHADTLEQAVARYVMVCDETNRVVAAAPSLDALCPRFDDEPAVNLRWILLHLLEETARHAGHADILRETIDGTTGR